MRKMEWNSPEISPYLGGEEICSGLNVYFPKKPEILIDRVAFLREISKGKNVLHIGCVDHLELVKTKMKKGTFLHREISRVSMKCLGVDINCEGVEALKSIGIKNVKCVDLSNEVDEEVLRNKWDLVLVAEVLEHIIDPVSFLKKFLENYKGSFNEIVITVPNAFRRRNWILAKKGIEGINSDHKYWFSPYTLQKIGYLSGLKMTNIYYYDGYFRKERKILSKIKHWNSIRFVKKFPFFSDGLIGVFSAQGGVFP